MGMELTGPTISIDQPDSPLMGRLQKIVDRLYRIEGDQGHFHKNGVPKGHGPVPEPREFQGLKFPSLLGLAGDESLFVVHKIQKVVLLPFVIADSTDQVHRIEMGRVP